MHDLNGFFYFYVFLACCFYMTGWLWNNWLFIWLVVCFCLLAVFVCQLSLLCHPLSQNSNQAYGRQPLDSWVKINTEYQFLVATLERGDHITGIGAQKCATVIRERTVGNGGRRVVETSRVGHIQAVVGAPVLPQFSFQSPTTAFAFAPYPLSSYLLCQICPNKKA